MSELVKKIRDGFEDRMDQFFMRVYGEPLSVSLVRSGVVHPDEIVSLCETMAFWGASFGVRDGIESLQRLSSLEEDRLCDLRERFGRAASKL